MENNHINCETPRDRDSIKTASPPQINLFRETLKEIYNMACFDWDTMPESARREFQRQILRMIEDAFKENDLLSP